MNETAGKTNGNRKYINVLWFIPILVMMYIGWMNIRPFGSTNSYYIDVGGAETSGQAQITGPFTDISGQQLLDEVTNGESEGQPINFELDSNTLRSADIVDLIVKLEDKLPSDGALIVGVNDQSGSGYLWQEAYVPFYSTLADLPLVAANNSIRVYATRPDVKRDFSSVDDFLQNVPEGSVVATNEQNLQINQKINQNQLGETGDNEFAFDDKLQDSSAGTGDTGTLSSDSNRFEDGLLTINTTLRGTQTLWTYVSNGTLQLEISKQDLNLYKSLDNLMIDVYSLSGELKATTSIPDDGDVTGDGKMGPVQTGSLRIGQLEPGAYRLELKANGDTLIRKIQINQEKLVVDKDVWVIGAGSDSNVEPGPVTLYGESFRIGELTLFTYHSSSLQQVSFQNKDLNTKFDINKTNTDFNFSLEPGNYSLTAPKGDLIISSDSYYSFTPDSFFIPKRAELINLKYNLQWARENADYIVVPADYTPPIKQNDGQIIIQTSWERADLFIEDNKLDFSIDEIQSASDPVISIPVKSIEVRVQTLPIYKKLN